MAEKEKIIITIDGPAGSGKSSIAKKVAQVLGYRYLDSGATYRAVTWKAIQDGSDMEDSHALGKVASGLALELREDGRIFLEGRELAHELRTPEVDRWVSPVSAFPEVRQAMVILQRRLGEGKGLVAEGRDMGTIVFPDAEKKFYLDALPEVRARRRLQQRRGMGLEGDYEEILAGVLERDQRDSSRPHSPLKTGEKTIVIDTTSLSEEEVLARILRETRKK